MKLKDKIELKKLNELADEFIKKIPKGTLNGDSKTAIAFEIGQFLRFVRKQKV